MDKMKEYAAMMSKEMIELSEKNAVDFLMGLVKSGDLVRHVCMSSNGDSEGWTYIPYRGVQDLKMENERLRNKLDDIERTINEN